MPREWLKMVKENLKTVPSYFNTSRFFKLPLSPSYSTTANTPKCSAAVPLVLIREWLKMVKENLKTVPSYFNTSRMLIDYANQYYVPLHELQKEFNANSFTPKCSAAVPLVLI